MIKIVKPYQDTRVDRPTVGLNTLHRMYEAGLRGLVVEANGVIVHQLAEMIDLADQHDIFLIGIDPL